MRKYKGQKMRYDDGCYEGKKRTVEKSYVLGEYPKFRKNKDFRFIARFWQLCRKLFRIEISGLENIPEKESFLISGYRSEIYFSN